MNYFTITSIVVCLPLLACSSSKSSTAVDAHNDGTPSDGVASDSLANETSASDTTTTSETTVADTNIADTALADVTWNAATEAIPVSPFIVTDQFGYRTADEKIAVLRTPVTGFDVGTTYAPSASLSVVDVTTGTSVWSGAPAAWNGGATDAQSGDKTWWLTFTTLATPGTYVVVDTGNNIRSYPFRIDDHVYVNVFKAAQKMYFYQRFGIAKTAANAGAGWADALDFPGDTTCQDFLNKNNPKDLSGGWFDAGDYNKYVNWAATDVIQLLRAYAESPSAFTDDVNIPESGNGVPDILDEVMWELNWMEKMQDATGNHSVLSVAGEVAPATGGVLSPPSACNYTCYYGEANTSATLSTAGAFAYASIVLKTIPSLTTYAADLQTRAEAAWTWAVANPNVTFKNNDAASGTSGLAAGQQEVGAADLAQIKIDAAALLFAATGNATYQTFFDANYNTNTGVNFTMTDIAGYMGPWWGGDLGICDALLTYANATGATPAVASLIKTSILAGLNGDGEDFPAYTNKTGSYVAYLATYTWGSNSEMAIQGLNFALVPIYGLDATKNTTAMAAAERHIHYFHGVNPLQKVYLTNLESIGASNSVHSLYSSWFSPGTVWSATTATDPGPAPGYIPGGPNPGYTIDGCCPAGCGSAANNALCVTPIPPSGQPPMKSYKDFNDNWPLDSWSVTEPDLGYQAPFVRLLAKFVNN